MREVVLRWPTTLVVLPLVALACSHDWTVRPKAADLADAATDGPTAGNGEGGGAAARLTELASGEEGAAELVVAGEALVWTIAQASTGTIRACAVNDCKPRSLATAQDVPHSLIVEGPHVMWAVGREIRRADLDGSPVSIVTSIDKPFGAVRRIGERLYASDPDFVARCNFDEASATCTSRSTIGSDMADSTLRPLAVDQRQRLWAASQKTLYWVDLDAEQLGAWASVDRARALVASDATVFALLEAGDVIAAPAPAGADGGVPQSVRGDGTASAIGIDTTHLFVGYTDGHIDRHALSTLDQREPIASGLGDVKAIAVAQDRIFVALGDGRIGHLPIPPVTP